MTNTSTTLTDDEIEALSRKCVSVRGQEDNHEFAWLDFARAIEARVLADWRLIAEDEADDRDSIMWTICRMALMTNNSEPMRHQVSRLIAVSTGHAKQQLQAMLIRAEQATQKPHVIAGPRAKLEWQGSPQPSDVLAKIVAWGHSTGGIPKGAAWDEVVEALRTQVPAAIEPHLSICASQDDTMKGYPACDCGARRSGSISFEEAQDLARRHAKAEPESYYSEPFEPHLWVINAIVEASATWYERAVQERVRRVKAEAHTAQPQAEPADAKDASRYRWLRDHSQPGICTFYLSVGNGLHGVKFTRDTVDEAIDAQIATPTAPTEPTS